MISVKPLVKPIYSELKQAVGYVIELQCYVEANPFPNAEQMKWIRGNRAISVSSGRYVKKTFVCLTKGLSVHVFCIVCTCKEY